MAKPARRTYSPAEKSAYLAEIDRLYRGGGRTYASIAQALGLHHNCYHNWLGQGFKPAVPPATAPTVSATQRSFSATEREQLVAAIDAARARGDSMKSACQAAGISDKAYRRWKAASAPPLPMRVVEVTALVPVPTLATALTIVPPRPTAITLALTLVAPGGYRIEGLGIEAAALLLRALA